MRLKCGCGGEAEYLIRLFGIEEKVCPECLLKKLKQPNTLKVRGLDPWEKEVRCD